jgi:hypothetical protein
MKATGITDAEQALITRITDALMMSDPVLRKWVEGIMAEYAAQAGAARTTDGFAAYYQRAIAVRPDIYERLTSLPVPQELLDEVAVLTRRH